MDESCNLSACVAGWGRFTRFYRRLGQVGRYGMGMGNNVHDNGSADFPVNGHRSCDNPVLRIVVGHPALVVGYL